MVNRMPSEPSRPPQVIVPYGKILEADLKELGQRLDAQGNQDDALVSALFVQGEIENILIELRRAHLNPPDWEAQHYAEVDKGSRG